MLRNSDMHIQGPQIHQFNNIAPNPIPRSAFKRDSTYTTTFDTDFLYPFFLEEILPGDDISVKMQALIRLATPMKPIMDNLHYETFFFFVPNRLVWTHWENFQGAKLNPTDSTVYTIPVLNHTMAPMSTTGFLQESIYDYMTLPTGVTGLQGISALWNRGYQLIHREWFRDENIQASTTLQTGDGPDDPGQYGLMRRNKRKDYFTSGLPWPQKGDPVTIPLGTANVSSALVTLNTTTTNAMKPRNASTNALYTSLQLAANATNDFAVGNTPNAAPSAVLDPNGRLTVSGQTAVFDAIEINDLRLAAVQQQILELDARGGTRYVESIYSRFGVISPDFRLQRPELIGQGSSPINVYAVAQTAPGATDDTPQGNLAAYGTGIISGQHGCRYSATEHGMIIGLMNVRADLRYQQGINKMFTRSTRLDYYEPLMNGLGEQAILNKEIWAGPDNTINNGVFAYQERWSEYRYRQSFITGKMRSVDPQSLDYWHLAQEFSTLPQLNPTFIQEQVPIDRVIAVTDEPAFIMDAHFQINHVRPMPIRSNPGIDKL